MVAVRRASTSGGCRKKRIAEAVGRPYVDPLPDLDLDSDVDDDLTDD
jgi:hypothetical protein